VAAAATRTIRMRVPVEGSSAEGRIDRAGSATGSSSAPRAGPPSKRHNTVTVRAPPTVLAEMNRAIRASRVDGITGAAHD